ncbi:MAG TPA: ribosome silencing factor [Burkholderiaceae bacterium]|nr:ribosome silencing factor [Burkholderiaceae bacterium]
MTTETVAKKDIQKLQRAIVDGLEDVKAQDIQVFDTEHLSALFERVIVASGTSNRQTKALATSVRDAVRDAGFAKPRMEGEGNGEWIIVDCGQAVVHIMQPNFRTYYHLEELWGEKPVRLKFGTAKPLVKAESAPAAPAAKGLPNIKRSSAAKKGALELNPPKPKTRKPAAKTGVKPAAKTTVTKAPAKSTRTPVKTVVVKATAKSPAKTAAKAPAKKAPAKKAASRKA